MYGIARWHTGPLQSGLLNLDRHSETGGLGTGLSKHTGGSRSTVEHSLKMAKELHRDPYSWEVFKKLHKKKDETFVDARSQSINKCLGLRVNHIVSGDIRRILKMLF
ncbi:hypothetical protein GH714_002618 [Hevea brasiliensis]|uniref:Uncharacterized protein n=1 Tax=Hevea brasiliensis TaxID=3981 RepID=A0A6A6KPV6_HEVBR|nr:hypothetical protein GH714_002618 [Hevea brasiliensis]